MLHKGDNKTDDSDLKGHEYGLALDQHLENVLILVQVPLVVRLVLAFGP